jgi:serine/threonine protein kinase
MIIVGNKYFLLEEIGTGAFGKIYKGENCRTKEQVAIKVEPIKNETKLLKNESIIYQYLLNCDGIPTVKWFGKDETNYYMVITLLGSSLEYLKEKSNTFSLKLVLQIGIQALNLLKTIHEKGLVHRDIKPENFLLGLGEKSKQIYLIDFGLCKSYMKGHEHMKMKKVQSLIGSPNYASINAHNFDELSRRDDLESLGYMMLYLYYGKLPWQNIENPKQNNQLIKKYKTNFLQNGKIPKIFSDYFIYVNSLEFEDTPDYLDLIEVFKREIE